MKTGCCRAVCIVLACALLYLHGDCDSRCASAADHVDGFDSEKPSWQLFPPGPSEAKVRSHRRHLFVRKSGRAAENIEVDCFGDGAQFRMEYSLPASIPLDELALKLAYRSNRPGAVLALRVVFPEQKDPRTGKVLTAWLRGDTYSDTNEWQTLKATADRQEIRERIVRLRAELRSVVIDDTGMFIDRAVMVVTLGRGTTEMFLDDLHWTGFVSPQKSVRQVSAESSRGSGPDIQMRLDKLLVDGRPMIPRFAPHHGEAVRRLRDLGLNLVWIDDYRNVKLIDELRDYGIWAMATPPPGRTADTGQLGQVELSLDSFDESTDGILAWNIGTRIPPRAYKYFTTQARLLRAADRKRGRPLFADIGGLERTYSRLFDGVGLTRHPLQTEFTLHEYREFLSLKARSLRPGTFVTTWIQTEMNPVAGVAPEHASVVEPSLIRLQAYAALSAGCQGIGFWKRTSFDDDFPGARERELIIAILNQEIDLLEPWLGTRTVIEHQRVSLPERSVRVRGTIDRPVALTRTRERRGRKRTVPRAAKVSAGTSSDSLEMVIVNSPNGLLVMPIWYQEDAQYVPGQMAARDVQLTIPGVPDTATVWNVSTTDVRTVKRKPVAGGLQVELESFDQVGALVVSTDPAWGRILRQRIASMKNRSAALWLHLAKARLERVRAVDSELQGLGVGQPDGPQLLDRAATLISMAERDFENLPHNQQASGTTTSAGYSNLIADANSVRTMSAAALQSLRILQRAHWEYAVDDLSSPLSSPFTGNFQTLPQHWLFVRRIGVSDFSSDSNLLPGGDFEQTDTQRMIEAGWKHRQDDVEGIQAGAQIVPAQAKTGFALRLLAIPEPNVSPPVSLNGMPISIQSPAITIPAGHIAHISGRIRLQSRPVSTLEGVTVSESLTGASLRWIRPTSGWETFELIREATRDAEMTITLTLHGIGDVQFDDLRVVAAAAPPAGIRQVSSETRSEDPPARGFKSTIRRPLDLLKRLPGFGK